MKAHADLVKRAACGAAAVLLACLWAAPALAVNSGLTVAVNVGEKKQAGIGFGHLTDVTVFDLTVKLDVTSPILLASSRVFDQGGRVIFVPPSRSTPAGVAEHVYQAVGVKANYGHSAKFDGAFKKSGGGGRGAGTGAPDFETKLSDVDLDVDSDNDGAVAQNRPPSESDYEDQVEYVTGDSSPNTTIGLHAKTNEVIAVKAKLRKKKAGTFDVTGTGVSFYTSAAAAAAGGNNNKTDWSGTGANGMTGYLKVAANNTLVATFLPAADGGTQGPGSDGTGKSEDKVKILLDDGSVTFSPNPIVTGYTLPAGSSTIKRTVTMTVTPVGDAANVNVRVKSGTTASRIKAISIATTNRNATTGVVTFDVFGNDATPATSPYGDTTLQAYTGTNNVLGEVQVIVVKPWAVGMPHPEPSGVVNGVNACLNINTSPGLIDVPANKVIRVTYWAQWLTITVNDQFGNTLGDLYTGQPVLEYIFGGWYPINQSLSGAGTYLDPVSSFRTMGSLVDPNSPAAIAWPTKPKLAVMTINYTQNIPVKVAGHQLNTGIVNRRLVVDGNRKVTITWPGP
jgi:hypothetical protein